MSAGLLSVERKSRPAKERPEDHGRQPHANQQGSDLLLASGSHDELIVARHPADANPGYASAFVRFLLAK